MDEHQVTTRQLVIFTVVLSFIVSVVGTVLTDGILGGSFSAGEGATGPFVFNRPKILQQLIESKPVVREEDQVVKAVQDASLAVVSVVATKDVPVVERYYIDPFSQDPFSRQFFGGGGSGLQIPQYRQKGTQRQEVSAGSGFIVSADGLIITNKHVVSDTEAEYTILLNDGSKKKAKVLARDPLQDLAIIKIEGSNYPTIPLGDSSQVKIGQTAIAIGNALGEYRNTVSVGVISGLQRTIVAQGAPSGPETLQELIQTDAAINPGNSGGPLLNSKGEVIAIDTAVATNAENIGFAIPINKAKRDIENVKKTGRIIYPFLGVRYVTITKELADQKKLLRDTGVLVGGTDAEPAVTPGSPAEKAGIKEGDIILTLNNEKLDADHTLAALVQKYQVGDEVTLKIFRKDKGEFEVKAKLEERK